MLARCRFGNREAGRGAQTQRQTGRWTLRLAVSEAGGEGSCRGRAGQEVSRAQTGRMVPKSVGDVMHPWLRRPRRGQGVWLSYPSRAGQEPLRSQQLSSPRAIPRRHLLPAQPLGHGLALIQNGWAAREPISVPGPPTSSSSSLL